MPCDKLKVELNWLCISSKINNFNKVCNSKKLIIPKITIGQNYIRMRNLGFPIYKERSKILQLYKCICEFSVLNKIGQFTTSLGDMQLRNVYYYNDNFAILDLGNYAGKKVSFQYNKARFLVHLIDCNLFSEVNEILKEESYDSELIEEMDRRSSRVFMKRFNGKNLFSSLYRKLIYSIWRLLNTNKLF